MTNSVAQPFTIMTRRRKHGGKWETYQMKEKIVPAACCLVGRFLLLGDMVAMTGLREWTLCVAISFPDQLSIGAPYEEFCNKSLLLT